jgi:hypothetical protein
METTYLTVPNTEANLAKVKQTVAEHMIEKCLTEEQIKAYAVQAIVDAYDKGLYTIGSLARLVKNTPADVGCRIPQPEEALYYGTSDRSDYYFYTRSADPSYNSLEVKEEVR